MAELAAVAHHLLEGEIPHKVIRKSLYAIRDAMEQALFQGEPINFTRIGTLRPHLRIISHDKLTKGTKLAVVILFKATPKFKERMRQEIKTHEREVRLRARSARSEDQTSVTTGPMPALQRRPSRRSPSLPPLRQLAHGEHAEALTTQRLREIYFHLEMNGPDTTQGIANACTGGDRGKVAYQIMKLFNRGVVVRHTVGNKLLYAIAGDQEGSE